jgi:hypothetical protein
MHAVKLAAPAEGVDELPPPDPPLPALAHADVRSASALSAVTTFKYPLTVPSFAGAALCRRDITGHDPARPAKA